MRTLRAAPAYAPPMGTHKAHSRKLSEPAPLLPHEAFVVQLRHGTALTPKRLQGRIEHIVSGQATLFTSLPELCAFMAQVLAQNRDKPP